MTASELSVIGKTLFGEMWKSSLAKSVDISAQTIHRYLNGERPIKDETATAIYKLAENRAAELTELVMKHKNKGA